MVDYTESDENLMYQALGNLRESESELGNLKNEIRDLTLRLSAARAKLPQAEIRVGEIRNRMLRIMQGNSRQQLMAKIYVEMLDYFGEGHPVLVVVREYYTNSEDAIFWKAVSGQLYDRLAINKTG